MVHRPVTPPAAGFDPAGALLLGGALLMFLGLILLNLKTFRGLQEEAPVSRRELDRQDVAVGHDVVAAFEA